MKTKTGNNSESIEKRGKQDKFFGLSKSNLNYLLLGLCAYPIVLFLWNIVIKRQRMLYSFFNSIDMFIGFIGILLYFNKKRILGIICVIMQITIFVLFSITLGRDFVKNLYFWISSSVLVYFLLDTAYHFVHGRKK